MKKETTNNSSEGFYLVVVAIGAAVLISLASAIIGIGFVSTNKTRLQAIANLGALSALESYVESDHNEYLQKVDDARIRASEMISSNRLAGTSGALAPLRLYSTPSDPAYLGYISFGNWYREAPTPLNPCNNNYPCFIRNDPESNNSIANAVEVSLEPGGSNSYEFPMCRALGICHAGSGAKAIATMAQRCTAYVMDVSVSTFSETHRFSYAAMDETFEGDSQCDHCDTQDFHPETYFRKAGQLCDAASNYCPSYYPAAFALEGTPVNNAEAGTIDDHLGENCGNGPPGGPVPENTADPLANTNAALHAAIYCNMPANRPIAAVGAPVYRSDYSQQTYYRGGAAYNIFLDTTTPPEPLTSFLSAFNAGLQLVNDYKSSVDKAVLLSVSGEIKGRYPRRPAPSDPHLMATNLGPMIQITNYENILGSPKHPNFIDYNFFTTLKPYNESWSPERNTNLILGLRHATEALMTQCPSTAQKTIVLATDGVATCKGMVPFSGATALDPDASTPTSPYQCDPELSDNGYEWHWSASSAMAGSIADYLKNQGISVVVLLAGSHVRPNVRNYYDAASGQWLDPMVTSRMGAGFGGWSRSGGALSTWITEMRSWSTVPGNNGNLVGTNIDARDAYKTLGTPGVYYMLANGAMADLAITTGGIFCPLMPPCGSIDPNLTSHSHSLCDNSACGVNYCYQADANGECQEGALVNSLISGTSYSGIRTNTNQFQFCSIRRESMATQAARCVMDALSANPYMLVAEETVPVIPQG